MTKPSVESAPDLYAPWREPVARVRERHVGRGRELEAILAGARSFLAGQRPLPIYLFGPRGAGKSHLLVVAGAELRGDLERAGIALVVVPEDIPEFRDAARLVERMQVGAGEQRWMRWSAPAPAPPSEVRPRRRVVFIEGLDRQLRALGTQARRELRRLLAQQDCWWVGTGVSLTDDLTRTDEAFHGAVDAWPIDALSPQDALELLDRAAGWRADRGPAWWPSRRGALAVLAGGNGRALLALGVACAQAPHEWASDRLHAVIHAFTAHYQMRFRDLSPQGQEILELLATAPRELTPTEIGASLGMPTSQASVQAGRLVADGVLRQRAAGRQSWFSIGEPMFRFWLEYRNAPWDQTRAAWLARLLEALLQPAELASTWWQSPDEAVRAAAVRAIEHSDAAKEAAWEALSRDLSHHAWDPARDADPTLLERFASRAAELPADPFWTRAVACDLMWLGQGELVRRHLVPRTKRATAAWPDLAALLDLVEALRGGKSSRRSAFVTAIGLLARAVSSAAISSMWALMSTQWWLTRLLDEDVEPRGAPWVLGPHQKRQLAAVPFLRATFLRRGRRFSHPPLLDPPDVLAALGAAPDAGELLEAASGRGSDDLFRAAAAGIMATDGSKVPDCPHPARSAPAREVLGRLLAHDLARPRSRVRDFPWSVVSWAASFADVPAEDFARLLDGLRAARSEPEPTSPPRADRLALALAALARLSRSRFEQLAAVLPESARGATDRARLLVDQLAEGRHGRLHPELEQLRLQLPPETPG